jgi:hypothetical protein
MEAGIANYFEWVYGKFLEQEDPVYRSSEASLSIEKNYFGLLIGYSAGAVAFIF